jgi:hypothetical protein
VIAHVSWRGLHLLPKWRPTRAHKKSRTQFWLSDLSGIIYHLCPRQGISRGCRECELFFQLKSLQKILYRGLIKMEKKFGKEEKVSKNPFQWGFLRKAIVLNRIYAEIVV